MLSLCRVHLLRTTRQNIFRCSIYFDRRNFQIEIDLSTDGATPTLTDTKLEPEVSRTLPNLRITLKISSSDTPVRRCFQSFPKSGESLAFTNLVQWSRKPTKNWSKSIRHTITIQMETPEWRVQRTFSHISPR